MFFPIKAVINNGSLYYLCGEVWGAGRAERPIPGEPTACEQKGQACGSHRAFGVDFHHRTCRCVDSDSTASDPRPRPLAPLWLPEALTLGCSGEARGRTSPSSHHGAAESRRLGGPRAPCI